MAFKKTFLISDESVNTYGFATRTAGIRLENAKKNCPAFYEHDTDDIPLGHWENFRVDGNKLYSDLIIEGANELEKTYIRKIQNGDIKGASIGADPITWNNDLQKLQQGQTMPWLEECDLFEVSLTALPGNQNALALKKDGAVVKLNSTNTTLFIPQLQNKNENDMKQIALKLGLPENATEAQIIEAITAIQLKANTAERNQQFIEGILTEAENGLSDEHKEVFVELKKTNPAIALKFAKGNESKEVIPAPTATSSVTKDVRVSTLLKKGVAQSESNEDPEGKNTFDYMQRYNKAELSRIQKEEPEKYAQLAADYGKGIRYKGKKA